MRYKIETILQLLQSAGHEMISQNFNVGRALAIRPCVDTPVGSTQPTKQLVAGRAMMPTTFDLLN